MTEPLVSVVIPVHNGAATIGPALDSVIKQEVSLEVILVDDASTDGLEEVLESYRSRLCLRICRNEVNQGAAASRNRGVRKARGRYVAFLDADDYWAPEKLTRQLKVMEREGCVLCSTGRELMTPQGELTGHRIGVREQITYRALLRHNCINCSSVLLLASVAREFPMEHEDSHEDYITWLKILQKYGRAAGIDAPLLKYRLSSRGKSGSKLKSASMTFKVYRYMGFGLPKSILCFASYAIHGTAKYLWARVKT
ncbi:MAG: glycosyltransferase family 2 protein [Lachnospiraceae bacterium]|nr:glycosyltransferase family 2 protein [Lachnospiraceae bacterium]MDD3796010.1 glycosyltransferase family 2 protein [Lachnospiraceae bacterium]